MQGDKKRHGGKTEKSERKKEKGKVNQWVGKAEGTYSKYSPGFFQRFSKLFFKMLNAAQYHEFENWACLSVIRTVQLEKFLEDWTR